MPSPEILSKLTPKTQSFDRVPAGYGDLAWQDILQAMHSLAPGKTAFMLHIYTDNPRAQHDFFAGLFMEAMQRPDVQAWRAARKDVPNNARAIEAMCVLAVLEWKAVKFTNEERAEKMDVSLSTWRRKYISIYTAILAIPEAWEKEVMNIVKQRLL